MADPILQGFGASGPGPGPRGYCSVDDAAGFLGQELTDEQVVQANRLLLAVESVVDQQTKRSWLQGPITGEVYDLPRTRTAGLSTNSSISGSGPVAPPTIYLINSPVVSVQSITSRSRAIGSPTNTLQAGVDYELMDATIGEVVFLQGYGGGQTRAFVSYTPVSFIPPGLSQCAAQLLAHWLRYQIDPDRFGLAQYKLGDELTVQTDPVSGQLLVPTDIQNWMLNYGRIVFA